MFNNAQKAPSLSIKEWRGLQTILDIPVSNHLFPRRLAVTIKYYNFFIPLGLGPWGLLSYTKKLDNCVTCAAI